jgi:hypothetical protein
MRVALKYVNAEKKPCKIQTVSSARLSLERSLQGS